MKFKGNFKAAAITALGLLLLATVAGVAISALTTVRDATEDTPAEFVGMSAEVAVGPVTAVVSVAPTSPIGPSEASANVAAPPLVASLSGARSADGKQIAASWPAVSDATHYSLNYYVHDGNDQWFRYTDDITGTSFTMTGLQPTRGYTIAIQSVKKVGDDSYAWGWTNSDQVQAPPGAPRSLGHTKNYSVVNGLLGMELTSVTVRWTQPEFTGTGPDSAGDKLKYNISCRDGNGVWARIHSGQSFTITANNPVKHKVNLTDDRCLDNGAKVAISAINAIAGPDAVHTLD